MYRSRQRACPACRGSMDSILVTLADGSTPTIELCPGCRWVFVEFFDGEPVAVARALRDTLPSTAPLAPSEPLQCPDCGVPLQATRYEGDGPELWRCGECLGLLADMPAIVLLARGRRRAGLASGVLYRLAQLLSLSE